MTGGMETRPVVGEYLEVTDIPEGWRAGGPVSCVKVCVVGIDGGTVAEMNCRCRWLGNNGPVSVMGVRVSAA